LAKVIIYMNLLVVLTDALYQSSDNMGVICLSGEVQVLPNKQFICNSKHSNWQISTINLSKLTLDMLFQLLSFSRDKSESI